MTVVSVGLGRALHEINELLPAAAAQIPFDDILAIVLFIWFGILTLQVTTELLILPPIVNFREPIMQKQKRPKNKQKLKKAFKDLLQVTNSCSIISRNRFCRFGWIDPFDIPFSFFSRVGRQIFLSDDGLSCSHISSRRHHRYSFYAHSFQKRGLTGSIGGHFVATILAVVGGSVLSKFVSEKSIQYIGGSLFLLFAALTSIELLNRTS